MLPASIGLILRLSTLSRNATLCIPKVLEGYLIDIPDSRYATFRNQPTSRTHIDYRERFRMMRKIVGMFKVEFSTWFRRFEI